MRYLSLVILYLSTNNTYGTEFNCSDLIGKWVTERVEYSLFTLKRSETSFFENGKFTSIFTLIQGDSVQRQIEAGTWSCNGEFVTKNTKFVGMSPVNYSETYKNIALTKTYRKYATVRMDCDVVVGDCIEKVYEATKE